MLCSSGTCSLTRAFPARIHHTWTGQICYGRYDSPQRNRSTKTKKLKIFQSLPMNTWKYNLNRCWTRIEMGQKKIHGVSLIVDIGETRMFTMRYMFKSVSESEVRGSGFKSKWNHCLFSTREKNKIRQLPNLNGIRSKAIYIWLINTSEFTEGALVYFWLQSIVLHQLFCIYFWFGWRNFWFPVIWENAHLAKDDKLDGKDRMHYLFSFFLSVTVISGHIRNCLRR